MVESFGIGTQILGVKDECSDMDKSLDGSLHESHMRNNSICVITHYVVMEPWSDLESLLLVTEKKVTTSPV